MSLQKHLRPPIGMVRDTHIKFPPNWEGELPPVATREELRTQMAERFRQRNLSELQIEEVLNFLEEYEARYYKVIGKDQYYHRFCGGGAIAESETGIFCDTCGRLPDLFEPEFPH